MKAELCYTTAAAQPGVVVFMDNQNVAPEQLARAHVYQAWRSYDRAPVLPMTPLRWLAIIERHAALTLFPRTPLEADTP